MIYLFKALHVIGFVSWFAGLFYLVRIFVYHAEAMSKPEVEKDILAAQFTMMERRAFGIIAQPAMVITWLAGLLMLAVDWVGLDRRAYFHTGTPGWLTVKLGLLVGLTIYHFYCKKQIELLEQRKSRLTDFHYRLLNEVPTLFLVAICFIAVLGKMGNLNYYYLLIGVTAFGALVYSGANAYRRRRNKNAE